MEILEHWTILVGGFNHFIFSIIYGMSSFPLTFIFFQMVKTTKQYIETLSIMESSYHRKSHRGKSRLGLRPGPTAVSTPSTAFSLTSGGSKRQTWNPGIIWNPMGEQMHEEGTCSRVASHCQDKRLESFQWISIEMCRDLQSEGEAFSFVAQA